jgi:exonuclease III
MKIASFNVNGINGRLPVLLRWLEQAAPDIVCLQELKAPQEKFPEAAIDAAGYGATSPSSRAGPSRSRRSAVCPAIPTTPIAAISRRPWTVC